MLPFVNVNNVIGIVNGLPIHNCNTATGGADSDIYAKRQSFLTKVSVLWCPYQYAVSLYPIPFLIF